MASNTPTQEINRSPKIYRAAFIVIACVLLGVAVYLNQGNQKSNTNRLSVHPSMGPLRDVLVAKGLVTLEHQLSIKSSTSGNIATILVKEGQEIHAGQTLITIKDEQSEMELNEKAIELQSQQKKTADLRQELATIKQLVAAGGMPEMEAQKKALELELSENDAKRSAMAIARNKNRLDKLIVKSPMNGIVATIPAIAGQTIAMGEELMTLSGGNDRLIVAHLDAVDISRLTIGTAVTFSDQEDSGKMRSGAVKSIAKFAASSQHQNTVKVEIQPTQPINDLRISQQLYVEFVMYENNSALRLPRDLIYEKEGKKFVYLYSTKGIETRAIETTHGDATYERIVSGININDSVIKKPANGEAWQ